MTRPACSPEFPWACPPDVLKRMLRETSADENVKQLESETRFGGGKTQNTQPPQLSQPQPAPRLLAGRIEEKKAENNSRSAEPNVERRELLPQAAQKIKEHLKTIEETRPLPIRHAEAPVRMVKDDRPRESTTPIFDETFPGRRGIIRSGIIRNPLNPNQIAVVDPIPPRIPDSPLYEFELAPPLPQLPQRNFGIDSLTLSRVQPRETELMERKAELGERLDQLKSARVEPWVLPRRVGLPEPPLSIYPAMHPRWWVLPLPKPIDSLEFERRRKIPA